MADPVPLTPAQKLLEARRKRAAELAAEMMADAQPPAPVAPGALPPEPYLPAFDLQAREPADPEAARFNAQNAVARLEEARTAPGMGADQKTAAFRAAEAAGQILEPVAPKDDSWSDQLQRSFGQQIIRPDGRKVGFDPMERARVGISAGLYGATMPLRPIERVGQAVQQRVGPGGIVDALVPDRDLAESVTGVRRTTLPEALGEIGRGAEALGGQMLEADPNAALGPLATVAGIALQAPEKLDRREQPPLPLQGLKAENEAMYLMRVLGTVPEALVTEVVENAPVGPPTAVLAGGWDPTGTPWEQVVRNLTPLRAGDVMGGVTERAVTVDRGAPALNMVQGFLERVERGEGFEMDGGLIAKNLLGPEWENTGYGAGLLVSVLGNWEGAIARGPRALTRVAETARAMGEVDGAGVVERLAKAASNSTVDVEQTIGRKLADELEAGKRTVDDLKKTPLKSFIDDVAQYEYNSTIDELAYQDGLGPAPAPDLDQKAREARPLETSVMVEGKDGKMRPANVAELREPVELADLDPKVRNEESTAPGTVYALRNKMGDVVPGGTYRTLDEAAAAAAKRGVEGDEVWRSGQRPVLVWGRRSQGFTLMPTRGAEGVDALALKRILADQKPRELRPFAPAEGRAVGKVLVDAATGGRTPSTPPATRTADVVRKAVSLWARDRLGASELTFLPTGSLVSHADKRRVLGRVLDDLEKAGIGWRDDGDLQVLTGKRTLTDDQIRELATLADRWGVTAPSVTPAGLQEIQNAGVRYHGGVLADARYRVRGMRPLADRLQTVLADVHSNRAKWTADIKAMTGLGGDIARLGLGVVGAFTRAFFDDPLAGVPPRVRGVLLEVRSRMERVGDDLVADLEQAFAEHRQATGARFAPLDDGAMAAVMTSVFDAWKPVHQQDVDVLTRARDALAGGDPAAISAMADDLGARMPSWASGDVGPEVRAAGVRQVVKEIEAEMEEAAQDYLVALTGTAGTDVKGDKLRADELKFRTSEVLQQVYVETFIDGQFAGPVTAEQVRLISGRRQPDGPRAMLAFFALQRQKAIVREGFERLVREGAIVTSDELFVRSQQATTDAVHALTQALNGAHHVADGAGGEAYRLSPGAAAWVDRTLWAMGLEPGSGSPLSTVRFSGKLGTREFILPKATQDVVVRAMTGGKITTFEDALRMGDGDPQKLARAVGDVWRMWKTFATTGYILPRPSYFVGQWLGQGQTLWMTRGLADAARAMPAVTAQFLPGALSRHTGMVGELVERLHSGEVGKRFEPRDPAGAFLRTDDGRLYHLDDLEQMARSFGLADTIVAYETLPHVQRIIAQENSVLGRIKLPADRWQSMIRDYAGGFDQAARIAVFLQEVQRGVPPAEAAGIARKAALDFRDLTQFEAQNLRWGFTFYAYMRKATDALWTALLRHPERVGQQMRLAHWSFARDKTAEEIGASDDREVGRLRPGRLAAALVGRAWQGDAFDESGRANPRYVWSFQSAPVGISEVLLLQTMWLDAATGDFEKLGDAVSPAVDVAAIAGMGRRVGRTFDTDRANMISPTFTDGPLGDVLRQWLQAGPVPLDPARDDLADQSWSATQALGRPARWAAGTSIEAVANENVMRSARRNYQLWMAIAGPALTNLERVNRIVEPRLGLTGAQEAAWATGLTPTKERTWSESVDLQQQERERQFEGIERRAESLIPE